MSRRVRDISATSEDTQQTKSRHRQESATLTVEHTSMSETTSIRSNSPTTSLRSAATSGTRFDAVSVATTTQTGFTNATAMTANTSVSQQQLSGANTDVQPAINPYSGSNTGSTSFQQQPRFDVTKAMFTQADANRDGLLSREEFQQWTHTGNQASGQFHHQQQQNTQFTHQNLGQQASNTSFGGDTSQDTRLYFDYSVIEAYNVGIQSASDITAETLSGGFDNGGKKVDVVKAMFNQADANHDGGISRDEFRQWAQGGQSHSSSQTTTNTGNNFNHAQLFAGASPEVANILHQSGLGQGITNYS